MVDQFWVKENHRAPLLICLVGSIEYWWNTPDEPNRFNSPAAVEYRQWRNDLSQLLVDNGYLVYRAHEAFKGGWDERAQIINDVAVVNADVILNMTPIGVPTGKGTRRELDLAQDYQVDIMAAPPGTDLEWLIKNLQRMAVMLDG